MPEPLLALALLPLLAPPQDDTGATPTAEEVTARAACIVDSARVTPSPRQLAWQELEFTAFVHFGMNTFSDREWGDGTEDPASFSPTALDARQWVAAMKMAGMRMLILTCKHHDGFCLWPSAYTEHSVKNSPWRDGKGDVVREVSDACREAGLKFGVYLSPWDRNQPVYGDSPRYDEYFTNQLTELLTNYGEISDVWFDGACGEGPNGKRQVYDWARYWKLIRELQPGATISIMGPDVRWCGNEAGRSRANEWSVLPVFGGDDAPPGESPAWVPAITSFNAQQAAPGERGALFAAVQKGARLVWWPAQVNTSIRPGWFYHASQDGAVKSLAHLLDVYYGSVGGNAQFLLNLPPDRRGLIHENDVRRLNDLGRMLGQTFDEDLAHGAETTAPQTVDDDPDTWWTAPSDLEPRVLEYDLGAPRTFNVAMLQEQLTVGQRVEEFVLERATDDGGWMEIARSTTIGHKRLLRFDEVTAQRVRVRILRARAASALRRFGLFRAPALLQPPVIRRDPDGLVSIDAGPGIVVRYTLDGTRPSYRAKRYDAPFALPRGGTVRALAMPGADTFVTEAGTESRRDFGLAKGKWKVVSVDSEESEGEDGLAVNAIDDDPSTIWHTQWRHANPPHPHELVLDLGETTSLGGFTYLARQGSSDGGVVSEYELYVGDDVTAWGEPVAAGSFDNVLNNRVTQLVGFPSPVRGRFVRFVSLASPGGKPWGGAAELGLLPAD